MIKVYTKDVYAMQEDACDRDALLHFFLNGHREEYILVYRGEKLVKVLSYYDILYRRDVPEKVLQVGQDIFEEARKLFFSYENRLNRAIAVCNPQGGVECILYYRQNYTNSNYPISEYEDYSYRDDLDFELLDRADAFVFDEYEEYTAFISEVLDKRFPGKKKIFLDDAARIFLDIEEKLCEGGERILHINSKCENFHLITRDRKDTYSSLDVMVSLFWRDHEVHFGEENPDKRFMLIHFPLRSCGLADVIRFCMTRAAMVDYRRLDYIPVIDLSVSGDRNQFSGGRSENVWEDFFEPLNQYTPEEIKRSAHVLLCEDKIDAFNPYIMEQYLNPDHMRAACKKYLRLNSAMKASVEKTRREIFPCGDERVLGVVARGTDYRYGGFDLPVPMDDETFIALVKEKMAEWDCDDLLLATEDMDIFENFEDAGFGSRLRYVPQERYRYTDIHKPGILVASLKKENHDYHDEIPYLSALYLLAGCDSLIANCRCGAYEVADFINGDAYEHRLCCGETER